MQQIGLQKSENDLNVLRNSRPPQTRPLSQQPTTRSKDLKQSDHIFGADSPLISSLSPDQTHSRRQLMTRLKRK